MFKEYDVVRLKVPLLEMPIPVGTEGTVLLVYTEPSLAYEVELFSETGESFGTSTIKPDQIEEWPYPVTMGKVDL